MLNAHKPHYELNKKVSSLLLNWGFNILKVKKQENYP